MKQKKYIIVIVAIIIIIAVVVAIKNSGNETSQTSENNEKYAEELDNGTKINTSKKLTEDKKLQDLVITDVKLEKDTDGNTQLTANIKNDTSKDVKAQQININILDEKGNILTTIGGYLDAIKAGESTTLTAFVLADYVNAYDIEIVPNNQ